MRFILTVSTIDGYGNSSKWIFFLLCLEFVVSNTFYLALYFYYVNFYLPYFLTSFLKDFIFSCEGCLVDALASESFLDIFYISSYILWNNELCLLFGVRYSLCIILSLNYKNRFKRILFIRKIILFHYFFIKENFNIKS